MDIAKRKADQALFVGKRLRNGTRLVAWSERREATVSRRPARIVLALRTPDSPESSAVHPWVIWERVEPLDGSGTYTLRGDYCESIHEAVKIFHDRCREIGVGVLR